MRTWNSDYRGENLFSSEGQFGQTAFPNRRQSLERRESFWHNGESDSLIIEDNTVYEIDLDCMECRKRRE